MDYFSGWLVNEQPEKNNKRGSPSGCGICDTLSKTNSFWSYSYSINKEICFFENHKIIQVEPHFYNKFLDNQTWVPRPIKNQEYPNNFPYLCTGYNQSYNPHTARPISPPPHLPGRTNISYYLCSPADFPCDQADFFSVFPGRFASFSSSDFPFLFPCVSAETAALFLFSFSLALNRSIMVRKSASTRPTK